MGIDSWPSSGEPTEKPEEAKNGEQRLAELEARYRKLYDWAKNQEFVTVFRAEGDPDWQTKRSTDPQLTGSWYTEHFSEIERRYKPELTVQSGKPPRVFALITTKSTLESRDAIDRGLGEINIINEELRAGRQEVHEESDARVPNLENFLDQFGFVREYKTLKGQE